MWHAIALLFYSPHYDLTNRNGMTMAQMIADMLRLSWSIPFVPRSLLISMTYHRVFNMSSPAEATSETGTAYISGAPAL